MLNNSLDCLVTSEHLLMVAATLFMRPSDHVLAHNPVEMPSSAVFLFSLNNFSKFD
jgi:hypothetical protein